jgi:hypothetical protein
LRPSQWKTLAVGVSLQQAVFKLHGRQRRPTTGLKFGDRKALPTIVEQCATAANREGLGVDPLGTLINRIAVSGAFEFVRCKLSVTPNGFIAA